MVFQRVDHIRPAGDDGQVPVCSAPSCAAVSMPRAMPETTTSPASPRSVESRCASLRPSAEALRAPTMAIISRARRSGMAEHRKDRRRRSSAASPRGNSGSTQAISRPPSRASASISARASSSPGSLGISPPPRRASRGTSASAADADPKRLTSWANVAGPTLGVRASLSHWMRSLSGRLCTFILCRPCGGRCAVPGRARAGRCCRDG